jgi:hypothetical protein
MHALAQEDDAVVTACEPQTTGARSFSVLQIAWTMTWQLEGEKPGRFRIFGISCELCENK